MQGRPLQSFRFKMIIWLHSQLCPSPFFYLTVKVGFAVDFRSLKVLAAARARLSSQINAVFTPKFRLCYIGTRAESELEVSLKMWSLKDSCC